MGPIFKGQTVQAAEYTSAILRCVLPQNGADLTDPAAEDRDSRMVTCCHAAWVLNVSSKVHPCTGNAALYRPYGP